MINIEKEIRKKFPNIKKKNNFLNKNIIKLAKKIVHEDSINDFLEINSHLNGFEFVDAVLDYFNFDYTVSSNDIQNIPSSGKVVIIANHPLGGLDALCLLKLIKTVRADVKIIANDFLNDITALDSILLPINNFKAKQNKSNIKRIYESLAKEEALIIFPAGEVSRISAKGVKDSTWSKGFLNFAKHNNAPILPIFIDAKNSKVFYTLSILNKTFSSLLLSNEMFKKQSKNINIKIGKIIANENIIPKGLDKEYLVNLYKKHLYSLKKGTKSYFINQNSIAHPEKKEELIKELKEAEEIGETNDGKKIYLYSYKKDSVILKELGRLREISFRKVGEGSNKKRDTDKYDIYYEHIILWDKEDLEIVGSYRIGNGKYINENFGVSGFYSNTLFTFNNEIVPYLNDSIELGRSFIQPKYWGTRALDYLWYGIGAYLKTRPNIKYMFGALTLSNSFSNISKDMLIYYYSHYFTDSMNFVSPKLPYTYASNISFLKDLYILNDRKKDFRTLKSTLNNLGLSIPTLYKQYTNLCQDKGINFYGFNIDESFSNCIDGFIFVEVAKIKEEQRKRYIKN